MNDCQICNGRGWILVNEFEAETCVCIKNQYIIKKALEANLPKRLARYSLEDWNLKQNVAGGDLGVNESQIKEKAFKILKQLYDSKQFPFTAININNTHVSSFIFAGGKNSGKSLCLSLLAKKSIIAGADVKYYEWFDLCTSLDRFDNKQELDNILWDFKNCDLICIDGVCKIDLNNQAKNQLTRLFNMRINNEQWLLCSCNEDALNLNIFNGWQDFMSGSKVAKLL